MSRVVTSWNMIPCFGKCGTTRMLSEMTFLLSSSMALSLSSVSELTDLARLNRYTLRIRCALARVGCAGLLRAEGKLLPAATALGKQCMNIVHRCKPTIARRICLWRTLGCLSFVCLLNQHVHTAIHQQGQIAKAPLSNNPIKVLMVIINHQLYT